MSYRNEYLNECDALFRKEYDSLYKDYKNSVESRKILERDFFSKFDLESLHILEDAEKDLQQKRMVSFLKHKSYDELRVVLDYLDDPNTSDEKNVD